MRIWLVLSVDTIRVSCDFAFKIIFWRSSRITDNAIIKDNRTIYGNNATVMHGLLYFISKFVSNYDGPYHRQSVKLFIAHVVDNDYIGKTDDIIALSVKIYVFFIKFRI